MLPKIYAHMIICIYYKSMILKIKSVNWVWSLISVTFIHSILISFIKYMNPFLTSSLGKLQRRLYSIALFGNQSRRCSKLILNQEWANYLFSLNSSSQNDYQSCHIIIAVEKYNIGDWKFKNILVQQPTYIKNNKIFLHR